MLELAEPFAMSQPAISRHLKVLEQAGLISRGRDAQRRPCRLEAQPLQAVAAWVGDFRRFWEESYERLDLVLDELKNTRKNHEGEATWPQQESVNSWSTRIARR